MNHFNRSTYLNCVQTMSNNISTVYDCDAFSFVVFFALKTYRYRE